MTINLIARTSLIELDSHEFSDLHEIAKFCMPYVGKGISLDQYKLLEQILNAPCA